MKLTIVTLIYFLLPVSLAFADKVGGNVEQPAYVGWAGPLIAIFIIVAAIMIAKKLKSRKLKDN